jgi:integrase
MKFKVTKRKVKSGKVSLYLRIIEEKNEWFKSLKIKVNENEYISTNWRDCLDPNMIGYDQHMDSIYQAVQDFKCNPVSPKLQNKSSLMVDFVDQFFEMKKESRGGNFLKDKTKRGYRYMFKHFDECFGKQLTWKEFDENAVIKFDKYLGKKIKVNSKYGILSKIKEMETYYTKHINRNRKSAFQYFDIIWERPDKKKLSKKYASYYIPKELIESLLEIEYENVEHREAIEMAYFLWLTGLRICDAVILENSSVQNDYILHTQKKVNRDTTIPHEKELDFFLNRKSKGLYFFKYLNKYNRLLDVRDEVDEKIVSDEIVYITHRVNMHLTAIKKKHFPEKYKHLKFSSKIGRKSKTTNLLKKTQNEWITTKIMGWSSSSMIKYYSQIDSKDIVAAYNKY